RRTEQPPGSVNPGQVIFLGSPKSLGEIRSSETRLTHRPPVELAPEPGAGPALTQRPPARPGLRRGHRLPPAARAGPPTGALPDGRVGLGAEHQHLFLIGPTGVGKT